MWTQPEKYPWSKRHSWHSWRNRYKIRQLIFDVAIRDYVKAHPELLALQQPPGDVDSSDGDDPEPDSEDVDDHSRGKNLQKGMKRVYRRGPNSGALVPVKSQTKSKTKPAKEVQSGEKKKKKTPAKRGRARRKQSTDDEDLEEGEGLGTEDDEFSIEKIGGRAKKRRRVVNSDIDKGEELGEADGRDRANGDSIGASTSIVKESNASSLN